MTIELILKAITVISAILIIVCVVLQPSQKTGLMGDATDMDKREKRGTELFLYRATIVLIIIFFASALMFGAAQAGMI